MIKTSIVVLSMIFIIGCKSPISELPTGSIPEDDNQNIETPYVPPNGYVGDGGETDISIAVEKTVLNVVVSDSSKKLTLHTYENEQWTEIAEGSTIVNTDAINPIDVVYANNKIYMAFSDANDNGRLRFQVFNGTSWDDVLGEKFLTTHSALSISLVVVDKDIYLAYSDWVSSKRVLTVKKYDTVKKELSSLPVINEEAANIQIIDVDGVLHVVFKDKNSQGRAFKLGEVENTAKWVGIWNSGTTIGLVDTNWRQISDINIANIDSTAHVAYVASDGLQIKKFDGTSWVLAVPKLVEKSVNDMRFIQFDNTMYIAYADSNERNRLRVKYLTETNEWFDVDYDKPFLSEGEASYIDMEYKNGILYVVFLDTLLDGSKRVVAASFEID